MTFQTYEVTVLVRTSEEDKRQIEQIVEGQLLDVFNLAQVVTIADFKEGDK